MESAGADVGSWDSELWGERRRVSVEDLVAMTRLLMLSVIIDTRQ